MLNTGTLLIITEHIAPNDEPDLIVQNIENKSSLTHSSSPLIYFPAFKKMKNAYSNPISQQKKHEGIINAQLKPLIYYCHAFENNF